MLTFTRRPRSRVTIPFTSLIDIVFNLLIYFLLTSNFVTQQTMDIQLPQVDLETPTVEQLVVITVDRHGNFFIADTQVGEREMASQVRLGLATATRPEVVIRADREVRYDRVIAAMEIAKRNGASRLHLAIERR